MELISREALKDEIAVLFERNPNLIDDWLAYAVEDTIDDAPTIDPVKHGRWITVSDGYGNGVATASICECSLCKDTIWVYKNDKRKWKFCPNCGARMEKGEEDE